MYLLYADLGTIVTTAEAKNKKDLEVLLTHWLTQEGPNGIIPATKVRIFKISKKMSKQSLQYKIDNGEPVPFHFKMKVQVNKESKNEN